MVESSLSTATPSICQETFGPPKGNLTTPCFFFCMGCRLHGMIGSTQSPFSGTAWERQGPAPSNKDWERRDQDNQPLAPRKGGRQGHDSAAPATKTGRGWATKVQHQAYKGRPTCSVGSKTLACRMHCQQACRHPVPALGKPMAAMGFTLGPPGLPLGPPWGPQGASWLPHGSLKETHLARDECGGLVERGLSTACRNRRMP